MEIRSTDEAKQNVVDFTKRLIELLKQKKSIDEDIKELKAEYKEEGVPVGVVMSALNKLKALRKKTDAQIFEEDTIREWLHENTEIDDGIAELASK